MENDLRTTDPALDELRKIRHDISRECGHDPDKLVDRYIELQKRHKDRLINAPPDTEERQPAA